MKTAIPVDLRTRTKAFALRVIKLYSALPKTTEAQVLGRQVLRSGTSVGAHYREAHRSRSDAEFISKIEGGLQELEETAYWLELLVDSGVVPAHALDELLSETNELLAIFTASVKNVKRRNGRTCLHPSSFIPHPYDHTLVAVQAQCAAGEVMVFLE